MSPNKYIKLSKIKDKDLTYIRNLSRDLRTGNGNIKLDCTDVYGMEDDKLKALISDLPNEWKRKQECDKWINTDTLTLDFRRRLHECLEKQKEEQEQEGDEESTPPPLPPPIPWKIIVLLGTISVLSTIIPIISYLRAPKVKTNKIVLGQLQIFQKKNIR